MSLTSRKESLIASHSAGLQSKKEYIGKRDKKPEPYFTDEKTLHKLVEQQKSARHWYNQLLQSYLSLNMGSGSMAILQRLQDGDLNEFKTQFFARIEDEINKSGVVNEQIRANMRQGTDAPWIAFIKSIEINNSQITRIRAYWPDIRLDLNYFSIKNNEVMFTDEDQERLKLERASVFLDTHQKQEFALLCENIMRDLGKLNMKMEENGLRVMFGLDGVFSILNDRGKQSIRFNKTIINHIQF